MKVVRPTENFDYSRCFQACEYKIYDENVSFDPDIGYFADMSSPGLPLSYDEAVREVLRYVPCGPYLSFAIISDINSDFDIWFDLHTKTRITR